MGRPRSNPEKVQVTRRIRVDLWAWVQEYAASRTPVVTDTAIVEDALREYRERHEPKKKGDKQ